jgi:thiol-disulfide isomerase/thioredoxin
MSDHVNQSSTGAAVRSGPSRTVVVLAAAAILGVMFLVVWLQSSKYEPLVVGKEAPDFQLPDLNDKQLRLSDYRGKVVFLNFWATWCKPCREEMPSMEVLYKNFEKDGLVILAVSIDRVTTKKEIPPFVKGLNLTFPVWPVLSVPIMTFFTNEEAVKFVDEYPFMFLKSFLEIRKEERVRFFNTD